MPFGSTAATVSPGCNPSARSACTIWLARASTSPAEYSVPDGSTIARWSGSSWAYFQKPLTRPKLEPFLAWQQGARLGPPAVTETLDISTKHCTVERDGHVVIMTMN